MQIVFDEKDAVDWVYRGEGAANLVLSYAGSSPVFVGKVLRVQKTLRNRSNCSSGTRVLSAHECLLWNGDHSKEDVVSSSVSSLDTASQLYVKNVMTPLLGAQHVDAGIHVYTTREFLESVENNVLGLRPAWRVDVSKVNLLCDSALLISDHSVFPHGAVRDRTCISVEIKPKCGFLPSSRFIAEKNAVKKTVSRFRMHQFLKLKKEEISQVSKYDPLHLFSGSKDKIYRAIEDLFSTPHNNFRIFVNGSLVFGGSGGTTDSTKILNAEALEDVLQGIIQARDGFRTKSFLDLVSETIFKSRVLDKLLEVQKLDTYDIEGVIHAYYNIVSQSCNVCRYLGEEHKQTSLHCIPLDESLKIVRDYLIAATAKDCSLMISFRPRQDGDSESSYGNINLDSTKQCFDYKAYFIDLDMKPLKKIDHYYELDQKIVSCYNQMLKAERDMANVACIEACNSINFTRGEKETVHTYSLHG